MEQIITTTISIPIREIKKTNIDGIILNKLIHIHSDKCNSHGFVLKDSIRIISRSLGALESHNTNSSIDYNIIYKCDIILPSKGDEYTCYVDSITKMGIIAYIKNVKDIYTSTPNTRTFETLEESPLLIIVPQDYIDESIDINQYQLQQKIKVRILDTRIKYMSTQIQVVGQLIV